MGCPFSCALPAASKPAETIKSVRVVHLDGFVEVFDYPISVGEVTGAARGKAATGFICTPAQLLSSHSKSLMPDAVLEQDHIYLLLPFSTLHADFSPVDLAAISRRLTAKAKSAKLDMSGAKNSPSSLCRHGSSSPMRCSSPARASPSRRVVDPALAMSASYGAGRSQWRPILDTIREKSFNRRSESELNLPEKVKE